MQPVYKCGECPMKGNIEKMKVHFLCYHVPEERVPWMCSLCHFKTNSIEEIQKHDNFQKHQQAMKQYPENITSYIKSDNPYSVKLDRDIRLYHAERSNTGLSRGLGGSTSKSNYQTEHPQRSSNERKTTPDCNYTRLKRTSSEYKPERDDQNSTAIRDGSRDIKYAKNLRNEPEDPNHENEGKRGHKRRLSYGKSEDHFSTEHPAMSTFEGSKPDKNLKSAEDEPELDTPGNIKVKRLSQSRRTYSEETPDLETAEDIWTPEEYNTRETDLIRVLEPLKNISKALIALEGHFRKLVPAVEKLSMMRTRTTSSDRINS